MLRFSSLGLMGLIAQPPRVRMGLDTLEPLARPGRPVASMTPPTIYELCRPRADVLEGRIRDEDFAADLSQVLKGTAPELYKNPAIFFANTHPTRVCATCSWRWWTG
jgi:hypothetical protein